MNIMRRKYNRLQSIFLLILLSMLISCNDSDDVSKPVSTEKAKQIEVRDSQGFSFLLFMPANESQKINEKYPLIIFLHGIGERGNDLQLLKREGLPKILDGDTSFPFIVISPQCPVSTEWYYTNENNIQKMDLMIDDAIKRYPIDTNRIYLTGLSMGGIGTWYFAINMPERFTAIAPVAFRGDGWSPCAAQNIPVWAFHGKNDNVIPLTAAQSIVDQFENCDGNIEFTVYNDLPHDCWTRTYNNQSLYAWFLQNSK